MSYGTLLALGLIVAVIIEAIDLYQNNMFWPSQVIARWGEPGIAGVIHLALWSNLLILPWVFGYIVDHHADEWTTTQIVKAGAVGLTITVINQLVLMFTQDIPDPLGWKKQWFSVAIFVHFVFYMWPLMSIGLLFFYGSEVSVKEAIAVGGILGLHMMAGVHIPMGVLQRIFGWRNVPDFLSKAGLTHFASGIWFVLAASSRFAAGWLAGAAVVCIGLIFGGCVKLALALAPSRAHI